MNSDTIQIDSLKELKQGNTQNWRWQFWQEELSNALDIERSYLLMGNRNIEIYKGKDYLTQRPLGVWSTKPIFNILYSNIETLKPLLFSHLPTPRVRKRNLEKSNVNRLISILLERNIKRILEINDVQTIIKQARDDYLITKRGNVRVRLEIDPEEENKKIYIEYVAWRSILYSPAVKWEDATWIAFMHRLSLEELKNRFGAKKAKEISLAAEVNANVLNNTQQPKGLFRTAEIWEIWDKNNKKVIFFAAGYTEDILAEYDDVYNLEKFFNIPRPLGIDSGFDNILCPIPDYNYYEEQAKELDIVSNRIQAILPFFSMGGLYNNAIPTADAENFLSAIDTYKPVTVKGDMRIADLIYERDLDKLSKVLTTLYTERQQTIGVIQQITGISDIVRGYTVASETATAQELKGNFAVSRLQPMQQEIEFFCRDVVRIVAELLAEHYSAVELAIAAQIKVYDMEDIAHKITEELYSQEQQSQKPMAPEEREAFFKEKLKPYQQEIKAGQATSVNLLKEADKIMKNDKLRSFSIEIETDSTIKVDQNAERQEVLDFSNAIATVSQQFLPLVQSGVISKSSFKSILAYIMRRFEGSEEVEELLDDNDDDSDQQSKQQQMMQQQMMQKETELKERDIGVKEFSARSKAEYEHGKLKLGEAKAILDAEMNKKV